MVCSAPASHIRPRWSADYGWRVGLGAAALLSLALELLCWAAVVAILLRYGVGIHRQEPGLYGSGSYPPAPQEP